MKTDEFKINDRVWSYDRQEWGTVLRIGKDIETYLIVVDFDNSQRETYTADGRLMEEHKTQDLFFDEVKPIIAPPRPQPMLAIDAIVIVWDDDIEQKKVRYFSHFNELGNIECFSDGATSLSSNNNYTMEWNNWELYYKG